MASHIVFDTNYLRTLGSKDYLEGNIPEKLRVQIQSAIERGDAVAIPRTVQLEFNAWLKNLVDKDFANVRQAWELLKEKGFNISPEPSEAGNAIDIYDTIKRQFADVYLLEPEIDNYLDAERRASFRLPPLPKNIDGEEFRDRIIWSQLVSISHKSDLPIVIVSNDKIFENGANTEEGTSAKIINLKTEDDLNQWLDSRPEPIQKLINDIFIFRDKFIENNLSLSDANIDRVEDYRTKKESNGSIIRKFVLVTNEENSLPPRIKGNLIYHADDPVILDLKLDDRVVQIYRELTPQEEIQSEMKRQMESSKRQFLEAELKNLIGE
ncbi:PIN domain-containing protein [Halomonas sp. SpR1]|uniref:PIN domain-containing protein n=1 Tax=Halomonas sp. SpR1 TaxID=3050462 RepID=UPI0027E445AB|nr:PIN domain-containing protein [Halomonas sp. SpR1]MDQ7735730.1 PIN domain-containing protein [Halomonas sp. SpR1]